MFHSRKIRILMFVGLVAAVVAIGALAVAAQDDNAVPCDFGHMFQQGQRGMRGGGRHTMGQDIPQNCLNAGFAKMHMMSPASCFIEDTPFGAYQIMPHCLE